MYSIKLPTIDNGFKVIKEDGTVETTWNEFKTGRRKRRRASKVEELPAKKDVPLKKDL